MSAMRYRDKDGRFVVYDFGGGTLDVAIAESISGSVNLLSHGGIPICGGREFDRAIVENIVNPWIMDNFNIPEEYYNAAQYKSLARLALWASEMAKIELSSQPSARITLHETESRILDLDGKEIYLDIPIDQDILTDLISSRVHESISEVLNTIKKAGLTPKDIDNLVFIGGPTNYKPLRDMVVSELGIPGNIELDPMTAVSEGASLFAETIDWASVDHSRKQSRGCVNIGGDFKIYSGNCRRWTCKSDTGSFNFNCYRNYCYQSSF